MEVIHWKERLMTSGAPLEFEAAKILVSKGFTVDSKYKQTVSNSWREMNVDLHASAAPPFSDPESADGLFEILVSCAQRRSEEVWLFLPDPNKPDDSPAASGNGIRIVDNFSSYVVDTKAVDDLDSNMPVCFKGLEINEATGAIVEPVIEWGLSQLQFALPPVDDGKCVVLPSYRRC